MIDHTEELHQRIAALEAENDRLESLISGARRVTSAVIEERDSFQRVGISAMELLKTIATNHPRINPNDPVPLDEEKHHCEHTLYLERERLHKLINEHRQAQQGE